jgi:hypothetical protein
MKKSKLTLPISILVIIVFIGGIYLISRNHSKKVPSNSATTPEEVVNSSLVDKSLAEEKVYTKSTQYAVFDVKYPQFKNVSTEFNEQIANLVDKGIENHTVDSEENWKARYDTRQPGEDITEFPTNDQKFQFSMSWKPIQLGNNFISTLITFDGYTGGAHGYQNMVSYNYDVVGKKDVTLADLFPSDTNYLKTVSEFSRKDLTAQFREKLNVKTEDDKKELAILIESMMNPGTEPTPENFSVFTFTPDYTTLYFTQYQVAPYAMGEFTVEMPRK